MNSFAEKLSSAGYKLTKPRQAVWQCLDKDCTPQSARGIYKKIKDFDQASVYRALNLFERIGLARTEAVGKERFYCAADKPHHHIICRQCGCIESFPCAHKFNKYKNFTAIEHRLTLYGVCGKCNE